MNNTRKNKIICYTGIDSKKNGKHSIEEFRKITRKRYPKSKCQSTKKKIRKLFSKKKNYKLFECPEDTDDNGWIKYFGAEYTTPEECNAIVKHNKKLDILLKKFFISSNAYEKCKTRKCSKIKKDLIKERVIFGKEQNKACPQKSSDAFYKCSIGFYNNSNLKTLSENYEKCGKKKCSKEFKKMRKYR